MERVSNKKVDRINTTTSNNHFTFNIFALLEEFEQEINKERTKAGLVAGGVRGRPGGLSPTVIK